ncbi:hypothetical protein [Desulfohalobium retbaense]|uniref:Type IV secretion system coupling protein TraD DNA-binding domain-containing protein n=1 Tax=Desulfohalobium retbaense (strain ATCC 49708 / DSM 5692 / JCM 16813 / HR100) TaxID=485915 RepID=C8X5X5_DESRD|nr:hypothetical protein [Desulfohalobium retbaense]ACV69822.1 conserved hypothetical protein [Desulfohalobium retbaense DSM 5692]
MSEIGFLRNVKKSSEQKINTRNNQKDIFSFDSGQKITLEEANHNCLVLGATGTGKTSSFVSPKLYNLIKKGYGGLIFDVKNNFTKDIQSMANMCGREADIIEVGSHNTATPINFLLGLDLESMLQSLEDIIAGSIPASGNWEFIQMGINNVKQIAKVLYYFKKNKPDERSILPNLDLIVNMLNNELLATQIFTHWKENINTSDRDQVRLKDEIENDIFNFMMPPENTGSRNSTDWYKQTTWRLSVPRKVLGEFSNGILKKKLSSKLNKTLNFEELVLKQNKIVIIRFSAISGTPGVRFSKMAKEEFYKTIYRRFELQKETKIQYVFNIMDEFQDIVNLDENSLFDDFTWVSKSREFKVINIAATQSMSSLYKLDYKERVYGMLNNFGIKIFMQNDDPNTIAWIEQCYRKNYNLTELGPAEALLIKKKMPERKIQIGIDSAQKSHDKLQDILRNSSEFCKNENRITI